MKNKLKIAKNETKKCFAVRREWVNRSMNDVCDTCFPEKLEPEVYVVLLVRLLVSPGAVDVHHRLPAHVEYQS